MNLTKFKEGLIILDKYSCKDIAAEHDEFYVGDVSEVSEEDKKLLEELGFDIDDTGGFKAWV